MSDTMNSESARDRRQRFGAQRGRDLYWGFTLGFVVNAATMFMISLGGGMPKLGITAAIVGTFIFVCVNSFDCMDDFKANAIDDITSWSGGRVCIHPRIIGEYKYCTV